MADKHNNDDRKMSREEAGRLGGEKVASERGEEFYSEIGSQQGKENNPGNFANDREKASRAGAEGGRNSHRGDNQSDDDAA